MDSAIEAIGRRLDEVREGHIALKTVVVGINGDNGLKGTVSQLCAEFAAYRKEMREEVKEVTEHLAAAIAAVSKEVDASRKQRRQELIGFISVVVTAVGSIVIAMIQRGGV